MFGFQMTLASPEDRYAAACDMNEWMSMGRLKATIAQILPLSQVAEAHRLQEQMTVANSSDLAGKIVLRLSAK